MKIVDMNSAQLDKAIIAFNKQLKEVKEKLNNVIFNECKDCSKVFYYQQKNN